MAAGRTLVDFGLRRAHAPGAGLRAARASYLAGFAATSNVLAGRTFGIPLSGTMARLANPGMRVAVALMRRRSHPSARSSP